MDDDDSDDDGIPDDGNKAKKKKQKKKNWKNILSDGKGKLLRGGRELPSHVEWPPNDLIYVVTEKVDLLVFPLKYDDIDDE